MKIVKIVLLCLFLVSNIQAQEIQRNAYTQSAHKSYLVGELGEAWEYPSDHLPRGMSIDGTHIVFWNILNKRYLGHILENTQGLAKSAIMRDHKSAEGHPSLTVREINIINQIFEMVDHPSHPRSLVALQEVHEDVFNYLKNNMSAKWSIETPLNAPFSQTIFIFDTEVFDLVSSEAVYYEPGIPRAVFILTLVERSTGDKMRFIQSHVPGGPNSAKGIAKFSKEVMNFFDPSITTVLMGDMNATPEAIQKGLETAAKKAELPQKLFNYLEIAYPSHINTHAEASWIDHFFVYNPLNLKTITPSNAPEEVASFVVPIVNLLREKLFQ